MSRFVIITLLAFIAATSAKPYVVYGAGYYGGYDYPYYSYPYTPVTYVESIPFTTVVSGPPPVAAVPVLPAKLTARKANQVMADPPPPAPSAQQALPYPPAGPPAGPPAPPPPPPPPAPPAPAKLITISTDLDPAKLLSALPIQQLLELPPVKSIVALKTSKLEALMGLKSALQGKLATLASLLP